MTETYDSESDDYFSSSSSSSSSSDDESSDYSSSCGDSEVESDVDMNDDFEDLELLLADRAEELEIARSLGASYRALEFVVETHHRGSKKVNVLVNRVSKKMNLHAVRRKVADVRHFVRTLLSNVNAATERIRVKDTNGNEFDVTTDADGRRQISRVESLEKELAELKAMMASLKSSGNLETVTTTANGCKTFTYTTRTPSPLQSIRF